MIKNNSKKNDITVFEVHVCPTEVLRNLLKCAFIVHMPEITALHKPSPMLIHAEMTELPA